MSDGPVKFLWRIGKFLCVAGAVYVVALIAWAHAGPARVSSNLRPRDYTQGFTGRRLAEADTTGPVDVLVLGPSYAYRGVDTRVFAKAGLRVFNLGTSSQTPRQTRWLLSRFGGNLIRQAGKTPPTIVLYEVSADLLAVSGVESTLDLLRQTEVDWSLAMEALWSRDPRVINELLYRGTVQALNATGVMPDTTSQHDTYHAGGYVERNPAPAHTGEVDSTDVHDILPAQLEAFRQNLNYLREAGATVLLFTAPKTAVVERQTARLNLDSLLRAEGEVLTLRDAVLFEDTQHFYDARHLNTEGARLLSEALLAEVERRRSAD